MMEFNKEKEITNFDKFNKEFTSINLHDELNDFFFSGNVSKESAKNYENAYLRLNSSRNALERFLGKNSSTSIFHNSILESNIATFNEDLITYYEAKYKVYREKLNNNVELTEKESSEFINIIDALAEINDMQLENEEPTKKPKTR